MYIYIYIYICISKGVWGCGGVEVRVAGCWCVWVWGVWCWGVGVCGGGVFSWDQIIPKTSLGVIRNIVLKIACLHDLRVSMPTAADVSVDHRIEVFRNIGMEFAHLHQLWILTHRKSYVTEDHRLGVFPTLVCSLLSFVGCRSPFQGDQMLPKTTVLESFATLGCSLLSFVICGSPARDSDFTGDHRPGVIGNIGM